MFRMSILWITVLGWTQDSLYDYSSILNPSFICKHVYKTPCSLILTWSFDLFYNWFYVCVLCIHEVCVQCYKAESCVWSPRLLCSNRVSEAKHIYIAVFCNCSVCLYFWCNDVTFLCDLCIFYLFFFLCCRTDNRWGHSYGGLARGGAKESMGADPSFRSFENSRAGWTSATHPVPG